MKSYKKDDIDIIWESEKCTHSAKCALGLPSVFKPKDRPWIQVDGSTKEKIVKQVAKCPSGALSIRS